MYLKILCKERSYHMIKYVKIESINLMQKMLNNRKSNRLN